MDEKVSKGWAIIVILAVTLANIAGEVITWKNFYKPEIEKRDDEVYKKSIRHIDETIICKHDTIIHLLKEISDERK